MKLEAKLDRIKTEIKFLIEGGDTLDEKSAALAEVAAFAQASFAAAVVAAQVPADEQAST
jgi:hypothetical protein